ncbi:MAG: beta-lactamase family protein [Chitinophagaceae bacterium]|nr:beta-lactamase family protein [Chitinophagaceae bacterium]
MKGTVFIIFTLIALNQLSAQQIRRLDNSTISAEALTNTIKRLTDTARVTGLVVAVFNNNKPVYSKAFGYSNADTKTPLETNTEFYGASLSKAVFGVLVMKLVEENIIELDKPLQDYLPKPIYEYPPVNERAWHEDYSDLKADSTYRKITARMCLDHTTGFANWRFFEPDRKLRIHNEPGSRYSYSGEGLVYLQVVLEKMLNKSLETLMQEKIFNPIGMKMSSYKWQPRFESNFAYGHDVNEKVLEKDKDNAPRSAGTLETTPNDYIRFMTAVLNHKIISKKSTDEMFSPQIRIRSASQFGPLSTKDVSDNDPIQLSYGLAWGLYKTPYGWGAFKEGHGDGFQHYSIVFPDKKMGVLLMSNSDNAESIFKELMEVTINDVYLPWKWENYVPFSH